ncbi:hypothetical protein BDQ17DRAFT_526211 [Cyathus striatus]|nr:hypothetical protein BDQ17DRAFT_526211 [Cyathus striatus]
MVVAGVDDDGYNGVITPQARQEGLQTAVNVAAAALRGNSYESISSLLTIQLTISSSQLLTLSSHAPSITLISSVASLIPAPTRSLTVPPNPPLVLFQSFSVERPKITFTHILPATVAGNFHASAVDGGSPRELDPNTHGMKPEELAKRTVDVIDRGAKVVFMPALYRYVHLVYWIWPTFIERKARDKYSS